MKNTKEHIDSFIKKQTVASVSCIDASGLPYCFSCFYAYDAENTFLYFKTSIDTTHTPLMMANANIAGTILPDKLVKLAVQGIQFEGTVLKPGSEEAPHAATMYHHKYPFALPMPGDVWAIKIRHCKMTDNTLGFGKKLEWARL